MPDLPINLFDVTLLAIFVAGIMRGRKRGLSDQLLSLTKWLTILIGCAFLYEPVSRMIAQAGFFDQPSASLMAYLGLALLVLLIFSFVRRKNKHKYTDELSGETESYVGMASGAVRFSAMLLVALALLNARTYTPAEIKASEKFQVDMFGSALFPTPHGLQSWVFEHSLCGPWIKQDLGFLLINPPKPEDEPYQQRHANLR